MAGCLQVALYVGSIGEQTFAMYWPGLVASAWPVGVAALLFILLDIRLNMPEEIEDETYDSIPEAPSHRKARVVEGSEEGLHMAPEDESRIMPPSTPPPTDMKATMKMAQPPTALVEMQATMKMAQPAPAPVSPPAPPAPPAPPTPPTPPLAAPYPPEQPQGNPYPQEQATRPVTSPGAPNHPDSSDSLSYFKL